MSECILRSSHGDVYFDLPSGVVTRIDELAPPTELPKITMVDVRKLLVADPGVEARRETDILFAGYWYEMDNGQEGYEPPMPLSVLEAQRKGGLQ